MNVLGVKELCTIRTIMSFQCSFSIWRFSSDTWTAQATTGEKPPAIYGHTLTMIDQNKAVLFGGYDGQISYNDTYILDVNTWV